MLSSRELEDYLKQHIPITSSMDISVAKISEEVPTLNFSLKANLNHKKTAFGGSIHALATLSCWSFVHLLLKKESINSEIVIASSSMAYLKPIRSDFTAECNKPSTEQLQRFIKCLKSKNRARLKLSSSVLDNNRLLCARFEGAFVASIN
ncbi:MAG: thioesterase [Chlamydiales bacterium]|nr:thioesterase domain-containing protein [Chlamydiales bacterium]NCF71330.1 thioesterase [Chlamydiales bacterium]